MSDAGAEATLDLRWRVVGSLEPGAGAMANGSGCSGGSASLSPNQVAGWAGGHLPASQALTSACVHRVRDKCEGET